MIPVLTAEQMRARDRWTMETLGLPERVLMETAGRACAVHARAMAPGDPVVVVCGTGNNGGDGLVTARTLHHWRIPVRAVVLGERARLSPGAADNLRALEKSGGAVALAPTSEALDAEMMNWPARALLVDAIFGTGLARPVAGLEAHAIERMNARGHILAVDLPSGLHADTGMALGACIRADLTVALGAMKRAHAMHPGADRCGRVVVEDIGVPIPDDAGFAEALDLAAARRMHRVRPMGAHKGTEGHVLVVGGHPGLTGAAVMACRGALRAGAGRVSWCRPAAVNVDMPPEVTLDDWKPSELGVAVQGGRVTTVVGGPGLQVGEAGEAWWGPLVECPLPVVLDAGALTLAAGRAESLLRRRQPTVLTPHPAELGRLLGRTASEVQADRVTAARAGVEATGAVVVLKGARTVLAGPGGQVAICLLGNPVLAAGGSGDVLAGVVGALVARGLAAWDAAALGVLLHARAGDRLASSLGPQGVLPSEVADEIPRVLMELEA